LPKRKITMNAHRPTLLVVAWLGTLLLSRFSEIPFREFLRIDPTAWMIWFWSLAGVALIAVTFIWPLIQPLRRYFLMLTLIWVVTKLLELLITQNAIWLEWFGSDKPWVVSFFSERLFGVLLALILAGIILALGQKRQDFFLRVGELNAPVSGLPWLGRHRPVTWIVVGPIAAITLTTLIGIFVFILNPLEGSALVKVLPLLPAVLLFAVMNAFGEELAYRAVPLSQLWAVVGSRQAIWMTAVWFGLGHYYGGIPSGLPGAVFLTLMGALIGKAMLETKGIAMPVFIHLWGDVLIYAGYAMAS
jgi:membrane protease YdiL (CAAX protease family)